MPQKWWGAARGEGKKGVIILVLQYWTSFNPHHALMSLWWRRTPQLPPTHTLWGQTGTRADAAPMKTDLTPPPSWERWCSACVASALPASYTSSHTCIIFECFWYLRWILLSYKCDLALIICVWMGDVSTAILYVCVHAAPEHLDRSPPIRLTLPQE